MNTKNNNGEVHPTDGPRNFEMLSTYHFPNFSDDQVLPPTTVEYLLVWKKWLGVLLESGKRPEACFAVPSKASHLSGHKFPHLSNGILTTTM